MRYNRFNIHELRHDPRLHRWVARLRSQPAWVWKLAGGAALLVIVLPILTLVLTAVAAFAAVFAALFLARRIGSWLGERLGFRKPRHRAPHPTTPGHRGIHVIRIGD